MKNSNFSSKYQPEAMSFSGFRLYLVALVLDFQSPEVLGSPQLLAEQVPAGGPVAQLVGCLPSLEDLAVVLFFQSSR